jgi:hypothetical protein
MRRPSGVMAVGVGGIRSRRAREHGLHARRVHARGICVRWPALREHRGRQVFPTYLERERPVICRHEAGGNERTQRKRDQHNAGHEHLPATLASDQAPVRHEVVLGPVILAQSGRTAEHWIRPRKRSYKRPLSRPSAFAHSLARTLSGFISHGLTCFAGRVPCTQTATVGQKQQRMPRFQSS